MTSDHRAYVGKPEHYDLLGALQFSLLVSLGLREHHTLLDIGCGSLRAGKLIIPYLSAGNYFGVEPNTWLVDAARGKEISRDVLSLKKPNFSSTSQFDFQSFDHRFDFLLAHSIFTHAPRPMIEECLSHVRDVMKPTSLFVATFKEGTQDYDGGEWLYPGFATYTPTSIEALVSSADLESRWIQWDHPASQSWILLFSRENRPNVPDLSGCGELSEVLGQLAGIRDQLADAERDPFVRLIQRLEMISRGKGP